MSGGTAGPRTTCPGGQLVRGDMWSSYSGRMLCGEGLVDDWLYVVSDVRGWGVRKGGLGVEGEGM